MCEFGERVFYMPLKDKDDKDNRPPRYLDGIWLGVNELNSEILVGTPEGLKRSRSIMRRPDKWNRQAAEAIVGERCCLKGDGEDALPKVTF